MTRFSIAVIALLVLVTAAAPAMAQKRIVLLKKSEFDDAPMGQPLDGSPWDPAKDPDIDLLLGTYENAPPVITHGTMVEQYILTPGDNMKPPAKGALLIHVNRLSLCRLATDTATDPTTLAGEQELFYVIDGRGVVNAGSRQIELRSNICFLVPEGLSFTMRNTGEEPLTMYLVSEPIPEGFTPNREIIFRDESVVSVGTSDALWCMIVKGLFNKSDGFGTIFNVLTVAIDPMTLYWPHSHFPGCEETWVALHGTSLAWIGKQVRPQPPGTAYIIPNDRRTTHANVNTSDEPVKFFYFSTRRHMEPGNDFYRFNIERSGKK